MILLTCLLISIIYPDDDSNTIMQNSKSAIYFNFLGQNPVFSIDYDRHIICNKLSVFSGIGAYPAYLSAYLTVPFGINLLFGDKHFAEIGVAGLNLVKLDNNSSILLSEFKKSPQQTSCIISIL